MRRARKGNLWRLPACVAAACMMIGMFPAAGGMFGSAVEDGGGIVEAKGAVTVSQNVITLTDEPDEIPEAPAAADGAGAAPDGIGWFHWGGSEAEDARIRAEAAAVMEGMTDAQKVGQLFLIQAMNGMADEDWTDPERIIDTVEKCAPGGFILMGPPFQANGPDALAANIEAVQAASKIPLIISTDEEGGLVARASSQRAYRDRTFLSPSALRAEGGGDDAAALELAEKQGREIADLLLPLGINMDHAPVADTAQWDSASAAGEPYMVSCDRVWGGTAEETAAYAAATAGSMEDAGLGTTLKHFPSYGNSATNGHNGVVRYSAEDYDLDGLYGMVVPFVAGIEAGGEALMVTHNIYESFDPDNSMSVSPKLYSYLRGELCFDGLAMTDSLGMAGIVSGGKDKTQSGITERETIMAAIEAGADMVITTDTGAIGEVAARMADSAFAARVEESCRRVLCWKISHGLIDAGAEIGEDGDADGGDRGK